MASSFLSTTPNYSLYAIPAAWFLCVAPHLYATALGGKSFDTTQPRSFVSSLKEDQKLDAATKARIGRAEGAQQNGFENIGLFAAPVVAGNIARLDSGFLNLVTGAYLVSRALYNVVYITNTTAASANARTAMFFAGIGIIMTLFVRSGNALRLAI